jgi:hypothetical protein
MLADTSDTGLDIDTGVITQSSTFFHKGGITVSEFATRPTNAAITYRRRIGNRRKVRVPGRLIWRDATGALRIASVVTRDVSEVDAFVECQAPTSIPLYRLVHFQVERDAANCADLPPVLQRGKVLSAVYRVGPYRPSTGTPQGYALRLLVEPEVNSGVSRAQGKLATTS